MSRSVTPYLRATARLLRLLGYHMLGALILLALASWRRLGGSTASKPAIVQWWFQRVTPILGLQIQVAGDNLRARSSSPITFLGSTFRCSAH
jgi:hypothetical protein